VVEVGKKSEEQALRKRFAFSLALIALLLSSFLLLSAHLGKVSNPDRGRVTVDLGPLVRLGVLEAVDDCVVVGGREGRERWREMKRGSV